MKNWWNNLQPREQRVLGIGGIALVLLLGWGVVWEPWQREMARLEHSVAEQEALLAWMRQAASEVKQLRGSGGAATRTNGQSLLALADSTARAAGLAERVNRIQPDGQGTVRVWLDGVAFDAMLLWLDDLRQYGVSVDGLAVDRESAAGRVNARLVLRGAGA